MACPTSDAKEFVPRIELTTITHQVGYAPCSRRLNIVLKTSAVSVSGSPKSNSAAAKDRREGNGEGVPKDAEPDERPPETTLPTHLAFHGEMSNTQLIRWMFRFVRPVI